MTRTVGVVTLSLASAVAAAMDPRVQWAAGWAVIVVFGMGLLAVAKFVEAVTAVGAALS